MYLKVQNIRKLLFPTLVLTKSGSKDISQTSYLATPKVLYIIKNKDLFSAYYNLK